MATYDGVVVRKVPEENPVSIEFRHAALENITLGLFYSSVTMVVSVNRRNTDDYLLQFPLSNELNVGIGDKEYTVRPGHGIIIPPGEKVRRVNSPGWCMVFGLRGTLIRKRMENRRYKASKQVLRFEPLVTAAAREVCDFGMLVVEAVDRDVVRPHSCLVQTLENSLVDLLLELQPHNFSRNLASLNLSRTTIRTERITHCIEQQLTTQFTVQQLANIAQCSVRTLQVDFREMYGMSPLQFIRNRRLARARDLLLSGRQHLTISKVVSEVGYSHQARFAAEYKRLFGESPSVTLRRGIVSRQNSTDRLPSAE